jgi:hypothetical protein
MVHDDGPLGLDGVQVCFDDERVVSDAGIALAATLAARLGIEDLARRFVRLRPDQPGACNAGRKVMSLIFAMALGADSVDDCEVLRSGRTRRLLGGWVAAPSTLGTFLRAFTFGHVRQLDRVLGETLTRAWKAGAGPGEERLVVDVDSFVGEVHGYGKQGASFGYTGKRGYHPILASRAETGEVLHLRLRKGSANTQRGILRFADELIARVTRAGGAGVKLFRADSGFWNSKVFERLERAGWQFSIGVRMIKSVREVVELIPEAAWQPLADYPDTGEAQIAETVLGGRRLIVRRVRLLGEQGELFPDWCHFPFATNRSEGIAIVEREHRQHAVVELRHPRPQGPGARALPLGSLPRQRRLDRDRRAGAQPAALDRSPRTARAHHPRRPHPAPQAARAARPPDHPRRALDAAPPGPLALAAGLHRSAHPHPSARRRLTRPAPPVTSQQTAPPFGRDHRCPRTSRTAHAEAPAPTRRPDTSSSAAHPTTEALPSPDHPRPSTCAVDRG